MADSKKADKKIDKNLQAFEQAIAESSIEEAKKTTADEVAKGIVRKPSKRKSGNWLRTAGKGWNQSVGGISDLFRGVISPDKPTRRMSVVFFVSSVMLLFTVGLGWQKYEKWAQLQAKNRSKDNVQLTKFLARQKATTESYFLTISLGSFMVELKGFEGTRKPPGVMNLAELEVFVRCDVKKTCQHVRDNMAQVRDTITNVFVGTERQTLMTVTGKKQLKELIIKKINAWLESQGRVNDIFFSKLIIS